MRFTTATCVLTVLCLAGANPLYASPTNLAPSGTASADSGAYGGLPELANDGNRDGDFGNGSVWHSDNTGETYWEVDLGSEYVLDRVQLFNRTDNTRYPWWDNFNIEVRDASDAVVFSQDYLTIAGGTDWPWGATDMRNIVGQKVRISTLDLDTQASMAEFEVYGQSTAIQPNLALSATVTGQTAAYGSSLGDLNDGDIDGNFSHGSVYHSDLTGSGQFVQLDLGSVNALDYINIYSRTDEPTTGPIKVSVLDESFTEVYSTNIDMTAVPFSYDFTALVGGSEGRYVRVEPTAEQNFALAEIEVFGVSSLPGDLNGDGYVGLDDLQPILDHWNQNVTVGDASMGDIAGPGGTGPDGYVGLDDLQPVLDHWNEGTLPSPTVAVPEPTSLAIGALGGLVLVNRSRRTA